MIRTFLISASSAALLVVLAGSAPAARAENFPCNLDTQAFSALQKAKRDSFESVQAELGVRKELLRNVLDCLVKEVQSDREQLQRTAVMEPSMQAVRNNLLAALDDSSRYYDSQRDNIANAGLHSAKEIAANAREWRTNTFLPQQTRLHAFLTWANDEEFLLTSKKRLEELDRGVQVLRLIDHFDDIQTLLDEAADNYRAAEEFHTRAQTAFLNGLDPAAPLKLSLEALAKTYHAFIELSTTLNTILPHGKEKIPK